MHHEVQVLIEHGGVCDRALHPRGRQDLGGYRGLLEKHGCEVLRAEDTGRFPPYVDLYLNMLNLQLTYDALKIIGFDTDLMRTLAAEMKFIESARRSPLFTLGYAQILTRATAVARSEPKVARRLLSALNDARPERPVARDLLKRMQLQ